MTDQPSPLEARLDAVLAHSPVLAPLVVLLGAVALGLVRGPGAAVLALAGGLLLAAIAALWNSLRVLAATPPSPCTRPSTWAPPPSSKSASKRSCSPSKI